MQREHSDDAANLELYVVYRANLEHVSNASDDVADVQRIAFVRELTDRQAVLVDELVVEHLRLHRSQRTAAR